MLVMIKEAEYLKIPRGELQKVHEHLDLDQSMEIRVFVYPHRGQVELLDLVTFVNKSQVDNLTSRIKELEEENKKLNAEWGRPTISGHPYFIEQVRQNNELHSRLRTCEQALKLVLNDLDEYGALGSLQIRIVEDALNPNKERETNDK